MPRCVQLSLLLMLAVAALSTWPAPALATHVQCGDVITQDTTLDSDLIDCPGAGVVVGADDVTLELNGHVVDGTGWSIPEDPCQSGIVSGWSWSCPRAGPTPDRVVIRGGTVRDFDFGVHMVGTERSRISDLAVSGGFGGINVVDESRDTVITRNRTTGNWFGVIVGDVAHVVVSHNIARDNTHAGFGGEGIDDSRFEHNLLTGNMHGTILHSIHRSVVAHNRSYRNSVGLDLDDGVHDTVVAGNAVADNGSGIVMQEGVHDNRIDGNSVLRNGAGIYLGEGNRNRISGNRLSANGGRAAIELAYSDQDNVITANQLVRNSGDGILLGGGATRNLVEANRFLQNGGDGVHLEAPFFGEDSSGNVVRANLAVGNSDDGVDSDSAQTTIARNVVVRNGDLGIETVPEAIDGGGNRAVANGNPLQCLNVFCR